MVLIGKEARGLPAFIRRDSRVTITGPVENSSTWLELARVAVAPLRCGAGVSVKIAEAWRAGCAVVATSVGARGYLPGEGMAIADDPADFASAVAGLLLDAGRRQQLAKAGRRRFEQEYCWSAVHERLDRLAPELASLFDNEVLR